MNRNAGRLRAICTRPAQHSEPVFDRAQFRLARRECYDTGDRHAGWNTVGAHRGLKAFDQLGLFFHQLPNSKGSELEANLRRRRFYWAQRSVRFESPAGGKTSRANRIYFHDRSGASLGGMVSHQSEVIVPGILDARPRNDHARGSEVIESRRTGVAIGSAARSVLARARQPSARPLSYTRKR